MFFTFFCSFFLVLGQKILSLVSVYVGEDVGWDATNRLRVDLAAHVLRLDMGFHKLRTPGELIARIDGDVGTLEGGSPGLRSATIQRVVCQCAPISFAAVFSTPSAFPC